MHLTNQNVPMPPEYEEMMRHYLPDVPKALIVDAWKHNATPSEVKAHLERVSMIAEDPSDCHGPDWTERDGEYLK